MLYELVGHKITIPVIVTLLTFLILHFSLILGRKRKSGEKIGLKTYMHHYIQLLFLDLEGQDYLMQLEREGILLRQWRRKRKYR